MRPWSWVTIDQCLQSDFKYLLFQTAMWLASYAPAVYFNLYIFNTKAWDDHLKQYLIVGTCWEGAGEEWTPRSIWEDEGSARMLLLCAATRVTSGYYRGNAYQLNCAATVLCGCSFAENTIV